MISRRAMMNDEIVSQSSELLQLEKCKGSYFQDFNLYGKTKQASTTGAQLLNLKDGSYTVVGVTVEIINGTVKLSGTATSNGGRTIKLSEPFLLKPGTYISETDIPADCILSKASDNSYMTSANRSFIVKEDTEVYFGINFASQKSYNGAYHVMLNSGNVSLPYEPYTGGKPSPSPEYPHELVNAGKLNKDTGKYEVDVKLTGKNLFDIEKAKDIHNWIDIQHIAKGYVAFPIYIGKIGANITASYSERLNTGLELYLNLSPDLVTCKWLYHGVQASNIKQSATITANDKYVYIRCNVNHVDTFIENIKTMQIEISDTPTPYEPYKGQYLTLTSDRPITKWDKLEKRDGIYGWVRKSEIKIIDGTEILFISDVNSYIGQKTTNVYFNFYDMISGISTVENGFCNKFSILPSSWGKLNDGKIGFCYNKNQIHMRLDNNDTGVQKDDTADVALQKIKTYLKNEFDKDDPFIFLCETKTETFVPLSDSEQQSLNALHTYSDTTVVMNDADARMKVFYKKVRS